MKSIKCIYTPKNKGLIPKIFADILKGALKNWPELIKNSVLIVDNDEKCVWVEMANDKAEMRAFAKGFQKPMSYAQRNILKMAGVTTTILIDDKEVDTKTMDVDKL
jgi:hypothetical protein